MKKIISLLYVVSFMIMLINQTSFADGMVFSPPTGPATQIEVIPEEEQYCFINYNQDSQSMFLSIDLKTENDKKSVWIFPVPAEPKDVIMNVIDAQFSISGTEVNDAAKDKIEKVKDGMLATQIYPLLFEDDDNNWGYKSYDGMSAMGIMTDDSSINETQGVTVYEQIDKMGTRTELITAVDEMSIKKYLESNGVYINEKILNSLKQYIGQKSTFVVSWITDENQYNEELQITDSDSLYTTQGNKKVGVNVVFPAKELYFPLKLTSIYDSVIVPANIYVVGHVSPKPYSKLEQYLETEYYIDGSIDINSSDDKMKDIMLLKNVNLSGMDYTKITINSPSKILSEDLMINKESPIKVSFLKFIAVNSLLFGILSVIIISILLSIILGKVLYKQNISFKRLIIIGASNIFSIIGVAASSFLILKEEVSNESKMVKDKVKEFSISAEKISICGIMGLVIFIIAVILSSQSYYRTEEFVGIPLVVLYFISLIFLSIEKQTIEVGDATNKYIIFDVKKMIYGFLVYICSIIFCIVVLQIRSSSGGVIISTLIAFAVVLVTMVFVNKLLNKFTKIGIIILNKTSYLKLIFPVLFSIGFVISVLVFLGLINLLIK
ncbi:MAG TPA: hypothetical protein DEP72_01600 [Clostridiales bacterium]|nr:MAG: hypothetical protein A2Y18_07515 [Clostridiales bacterium GWD2_32_19]HCC06848.1 hypothetical protein [Clostridiales bacterium]